MPAAATYAKPGITRRSGGHARELAHIPCGTGNVLCGTLPILLISWTSGGNSAERRFSSMQSHRRSGRRCDRRCNPHRRSGRRFNQQSGWRAISIGDPAGGSTSNPAGDAIASAIWRRCDRRRDSIGGRPAIQSAMQPSIQSAIRPAIRSRQHGQHRRRQRRRGLAGRLKRYPFLKEASPTAPRNQSVMQGKLTGCTHRVRRWHNQRRRSVSDRHRKRALCGGGFLSAPRIAYRRRSISAQSPGRGVKKLSAGDFEKGRI